MRSILYGSPGGESLDPFAAAAGSPTRKPLLPRTDSGGSYKGILLPMTEPVSSSSTSAVKQHPPAGESYEMRTSHFASEPKVSTIEEKRESSGTTAAAAANATDVVQPAPPRVRAE
jgi:hypothetical protein